MMVRGGSQSQDPHEEVERTEEGGWAVFVPMGICGVAFYFFSPVRTAGRNFFPASGFWVGFLSWSKDLKLVLDFSKN